MATDCEVSDFSCSVDFNLNYLEKALNELNCIFLEVCDKRSSSNKIKSDFELKKLAIIDCYLNSKPCYEVENKPQGLDRPITVHESQISNDPVLSCLNSLRNEFQSFKQEVSVKFRTLEENIHSKSALDKIVPVKSYANALKPAPNITDKFFHQATPGNSLSPVDTNLAKSQSKTKSVINGRNKHSSLQIADSRLRKSAIFVSRLSSTAVASDIEENLKLLNLEYLVCTKLKTRYETYSSFHVEIPSVCIDAVLDPDLWPEGCIVSKFYGKLKSDQVFSGSGPSPNYNCRQDD